jgi:hypothetical protein
VEWVKFDASLRRSAGVRSRTAEFDLPPSMPVVEMIREVQRRANPVS